MAALADRDGDEEGRRSRNPKGNAMVMLAGYNAAVTPARSVRAVDRMEDNCM